MTGPPADLRVTAACRQSGTREVRNGECKIKDVARKPHGTYRPRHARMMAPRSSWDALGVPDPDGKEPPKGRDIL